MKSICYENTLVLGSSAGYREQPCHNRSIESHWTKCKLP